jgi:hypothetical protein
MSDKHKQTRKDLAQQFSDQLDFLQWSAEGYDLGHTAEAKRLATTLRVILHDTKYSHSLLKQLRKSGTPFVDSARGIDPSNALAQCGLALPAFAPPNAFYIPMLDGDFAIHKRRKRVPLEDWWKVPVIKTNTGVLLSRRDLVLFIADQDGGAHVDPELDQDYAAVSRRNALSIVMTIGGRKYPVKWAERACVRQIAHEVLKTFIIRYSKELTLKGVPGIPFVMTSVPKMPNNSPAFLKLPPDRQARLLRKISKFELEMKLFSLPEANDTDAPARMP